MTESSRDDLHLEKDMGYNYAMPKNPILPEEQKSRENPHGDMNLGCKRNYLVGVAPTPEPVHVKVRGVLNAPADTQMGLP